MGTEGNHESFVLSWDNFNVSIIESLKDIRLHEEFFDVNLVCDEADVIRGHKVILSASSPYFRTMLKRLPDQNPVLIMPPGVRYCDLASLLDFIYNGEVRIEHDNIGSFLALAEQFHIRGLTEEKWKKSTAAPSNATAGPSKSHLPASTPKLPTGVHVARQESESSSSHQPLTSQPRAPKAAKRSTVQPGMVNDQEMPATKNLRLSLEESSSSNLDNVTFKQEVVDDLQNEDQVEGQDFGDGHPSEEYCDEYSEAGYSGYDFENTTGRLQGGHQGPSIQPPPGANEPTGLRLTGLLCPHCRLLCYGVDALKNHMIKIHNIGHESSKEQSMTASAAAAAREEGPPISCHVCDKEFKNNRYKVAHQKRVHNIEPERRGHRAKKVASEAAAVLEEAEHGLDLPIHQGKSKKLAGNQFAPAQHVVGQEWPHPVTASGRGRKPGPKYAGHPQPQFQFLPPEHPTNPGPSRRPPPGIQMTRLPSGSIRGRPVPGPSGLASKPSNIDIQTLGHKFGGKISIISTAEPLARKMPPAGTQLPVSGGALTNRDRPPKQSGSYRELTVAAPAAPPILNEEEYDEEDDYYGEGDFEDEEDAMDDDQLYDEEDEHQ